MTARVLVCGAIGALSLLASTAASAQFGPTPLEVVQVHEDLYMIRNEQSGNVTVLVTDAGVLLIDDKFEFDYDGIMEKLAEITDQPVEFVINTHYHEDHSGGNAQMQAADAVVLASDNARLKMLEDARDMGLPDVTLEDYVRVHIGGVPVDVHYFGRGHTDGDVVVHLPEHDTIVMGDLFAQPGFQFIHYAAGGSARAWPRTLDDVLALRFETVIPGHAVVTDRAALEAYRDDTVRLKDMVLEMNRQERTRDEIEAVLSNEFGWSEFVMDLSLDGIIQEMQPPFGGP